MPIEAIPSSIWPVTNTIDPLSTTSDPVFATSLFRFADQGMGLCICMHHNATDAICFTEIVHLWALNVSNPHFDPPTPVQNRLTRLSTALSPSLEHISSFSPENLFALHPEYSPHPPTVPTELPSCTSKLFIISLHSINILKELLQKHTPTPPTTNTILCALLWTSITRIRSHRTPALKSQQSNLITAVNARSRIFPNTSPDPHPSYLGNTVLYALTTHPARILSTADEDPIHSLATICAQISESQSPSKINPRSIVEVYQLIENTGPPFVGWDLFGSKDLVVTSWSGLNLYGVEFGMGIGRPEFVRVVCGEADGVVVVLPRKRGNGMEEGIEVMVMLRGEDMVALEGDGMWGVVTGGARG
ncbi:hypothetical protein BO94DRAFT_566957 [Aspergillus sclerotioniger CBS 115572]|uniref:Transferase family protein n=1 Tax=Aspergillus sclerotioniger CBS 115572 TaxID=1450535 RepID=A0A317WDN5_9EURO|nr:hypothetical protein BO94DRAFT_566957 [Aspergillus sclerotioniger CBS 115572]PWY83841.1 hypothetical protein BO94DRAFT_566957 [Aspergillus sclerotioniger CBS 115572]